MYEKELKIAKSAAEASAEILKSGFPKRQKTSDKKGGLTANFVTKYDLLSQIKIIRMISSAFPTHSLQAEEGIDILRDPDFQWVIDPLDGTSNYSRGIPTFASSIALSIKGKIVLGVISLPMQDEVYWAIQKQGAFQNDKKIRISRTRKITHALVGISIARRTRADSKLKAMTFRKLTFAPSKIRISGSTVCDLAGVASGKLDAAVLHNMNPWDTSAGTILIKEAGGKITTLPHGSSIAPQIIASNKNLHRTLVKLLK